LIHRVVIDRWHAPDGGLDGAAAQGALLHLGGGGCHHAHPPRPVTAHGRLAACRIVLRDTGLAPVTGIHNGGGDMTINAREDNVYTLGVQAGLWATR
jgi:hypothetical protein